MKQRQRQGGALNHAVTVRQQGSGRRGVVGFKDGDAVAGQEIANVMMAEGWLPLGACCRNGAEYLDAYLATLRLSARRN